MKAAGKRWATVRVKGARGVLGRYYVRDNVEIVPIALEVHTESSSGLVVAFERVIDGRAVGLFPTVPAAKSGLSS